MTNISDEIKRALIALTLEEQQPPDHLVDTMVRDGLIHRASRGDGSYQATVRGVEVVEGTAR